MTDYRHSPLASVSRREYGFARGAGDTAGLQHNLASNIKVHHTWDPIKTIKHTDNGGVFNFDFSKDGSILGVACERKSVLLFDPFNGKLVASKDDAHTDCVNCVKFLDDRMFATCSDDTTVALWDVRYLKHSVQVFRGHSNWVKNIEYDAGGGRLVTSGFDGCIYTWDINRYCSEDTTSNRVFYTSGLMRSKLFPDASKLLISTHEGYIIIVHNLDLSTLAEDLKGFKPNMYRLMQRTKTPLRIGLMYNHVFEQKTNRVEFISDWPTGNDANIISSLQVHPQGWCVASRNTDSTENTEWTCVHEIQTDPDSDPEEVVCPWEAEAPHTSSSFCAPTNTPAFSSVAPSHLSRMYQRLGGTGNSSENSATVQRRNRWARLRSGADRLLARRSAMDQTRVGRRAGVRSTGHHVDGNPASSVSRNNTSDTEQQSTSDHNTGEHSTEDQDTALGSTGDQITAQGSAGDQNTAQGSVGDPNTEQHATSNSTPSQSTVTDPPSTSNITAGRSGDQTEGLAHTDNRPGTSADQQSRSVGPRVPRSARQFADVTHPVTSVGPLDGPTDSNLEPEQEPNPEPEEGDSSSGRVHNALIQIRRSARNSEGNFTLSIAVHTANGRTIEFNQSDLESEEEEDDNVVIEQIISGVDNDAHDTRNAELQRRYFTRLFQRNETAQEVVNRNSSQAQSTGNAAVNQVLHGHVHTAAVSAGATAGTSEAISDVAARTEGRSEDSAGSNVEANSQANTAANTTATLGANTGTDTESIVEANTTAKLGITVESNAGANVEANTGAILEAEGGANLEVNVEANTEANVAGSTEPSPIFGAIGGVDSDGDELMRNNSESDNNDALSPNEEQEAELDLSDEEDTPPRLLGNHTGVRPRLLGNHTGARTRLRTSPGTSMVTQSSEEEDEFDLSDEDDPIARHARPLSEELFRASAGTRQSDAGHDYLRDLRSVQRDLRTARQNLYSRATTRTTQSVNHNTRMGTYDDYESDSDSDSEIPDTAPESNNLSNASDSTAATTQSNSNNTVMFFIRPNSGDRRRRVFNLRYMDSYTERENNMLQTKIHMNQNRLKGYIEECNVGRGFIKELAFSSDGRLISSPFGFGFRIFAFDSNCNELCDCVPTSPVKLYEVTCSLAHVNCVVATKFSPTHNLVVSGCLDGKITFHQPLL